MTKKQTNIPGKRRFVIDCSGPTKTQQHMKDLCDPAKIVAAYQQTGIDPFADRKARENFGFATSQGFTEAALEVARLNSAFEELPSERRHGYDNDPHRWIEDILTPEESPPPRNAS